MSVLILCIIFDIRYLLISLVSHLLSFACMKLYIINFRFFKCYYFFSFLFDRIKNLVFSFVRFLISQKSQDYLSLSEKLHDKYYFFSTIKLDQN